jgi:hypothetical protein
VAIIWLLPFGLAYLVSVCKKFASFSGILELVKTTQEAASEFFRQYE